jgi:Co/Zn/Cd efflux system component
MFEEIPKKRNTSIFGLLLELLVVVGALADLSKNMRSTFGLHKIFDLSVFVAGVVSIIVGLRAREK